MRKEKIIVAGTTVEVWWKAVKNINLAVYGPDGRVRISVPPFTTGPQVHRAVVQGMDWIRKQQAKFQGRPLVQELQAVDGESHLLWGKSYPLHVDESSRRHSVSFSPDSGFVIHVRPGRSAEVRLRLLQDFYRLELQQRIPSLLKKWEPRIGKKVGEYRIKRMKTRWGTCNIQDRRVWLNLELAKKPEICLEYILVHEMVHLLERCHSKKFYGHMDRLLPGWRTIDILLKGEG
ncbi:MAG: SprT family zinc-dependent metalloprotease [Thermodesulfobacteriota bacterium]